MSDNHPTWLRIAILIGVSLFLIFYYRNSLWSGSVDVALHYSLSARIKEFGQLPKTFDPSLGLVNGYPIYAHTLAVIFGNLLGSTFAGMQFVALLSLISLWCAFAFIFNSLPRRVLWNVFAVLIVAFLTNRFLVHLEIFGHEIIGNFFFAHLVAQAVAIVVITIALFVERTGKSPLIIYMILAVAVPITQQMHLMPALEIFAVLVLLVLTDVWQEKKENRSRTFLWGVLAIFASFSLTVLDPAFATMNRLSENNGVLEFIYTPNLNTLVIECIILISLSTFLWIQWIRWYEPEVRRNGLILKYLSLLGVAIAGLCLFQVMMLKLGYGSEYAVKKYGFGLNTVLFLELPLLLVVRPKTNLETLQDTSHPRVARMFHHVFLGLFVFVAVFTVIPSPSRKVIAIKDVLEVERFVLDHRRSNLAKSPDAYDYGIGLFERQPVFDYLITIGVLKAPQSTNAFDIMNGYAPSEPELIGRLFTRTDSEPWDFPACRNHLSREGFEILDGSCVLAEINAAKTTCSGTISFTDQNPVYLWDVTGFGTPWANGSWSVDDVGSFTCKLPAEAEARPTTAFISGYGFVTENHTQRMWVSINGSTAKEVMFATDELVTMKLDLLPQSTDFLEFQFTFPDAVSPKELGISVDPRKLGVSIVSIEFR